MSFRNRSKPSNPSKIVLPITPMLDMTFQLLFFFIVNFKGMSTAQIEGQMDMALPTEQTTSDPNNPPPNKTKTHDPEIEFPSDVTVKVRAALDEANMGAISDLSIRDANGKEQGVGSDLDALKARLIRLREDLSQKDNIKVQGDAKLKVKSVTEVMDTCRKAGFKNVSMIPPDDAPR